jgi:hypothetical protein
VLETGCETTGIEVTGAVRQPALQLDQYPRADTQDRHEERVLSHHVDGTTASHSVVERGVMEPLELAFVAPDAATVLAVRSDEGLMKLKLVAFAPTAPSQQKP